MLVSEQLTLPHFKFRFYDNLVCHDLVYICVTKIRKLLMQITVKSRNIELTESLKGFVNEKFSKLERQAEGVKEILVTLSVEKLEQKAEAVVEVVGDTYHTEAVGEDLYAAIDVLLDKVVRIIVKHKEKLMK